MEDRIKILVNSLESAKSRGDVQTTINIETEIQLINIYLDAERNSKLLPGYLKTKQVNLKFSEELLKSLPDGIRTSLIILQSERNNHNNK